MPYKKLKEEHYKNFGGINTRISPYIEGPHEFLDIVNFDFQTPGSLTQRWGTTTYTNGQSFFGQVHSLFEYAKLDGSSSIIASHTGGMWSINASLAIGVSAANLAATTGFSYLLYRPVFNMNQNEASQAGYLTYGVTPSRAVYYLPRNFNSKFDFVTMNNYLYIADGTQFYKSDGSTLTPALLNIPMMSSFASVGSFAPASGNYPFSASLYYNICCYFVGTDGTTGPIAFLSNVFTGASTRAYRLSGMQSHWFGVSNITFCSTIGYTSGSPVTDAFKFYVNDSSWVMPGFTSGWDLSALDPGNVIPSSGATITSNFGYLGDYAGLTTGINYPSQVAPSYLEVYQNRLMMSGFAYNGSVVWYSEVGLVNYIQPESFIEVRTNDGDSITALKNYGPRLMIFKKFSFHVLSGDSPENFTVGQVSDEYGCINNRCVVVYNDLLAFLDRKGVISFNAASSELLSYKIQSTIDRINFDAAKDTACMVNDTTRNQLLLAVPVDGATYNNLTIVYDYINQAWSKYEGYNPAVFAVMSGRLSTRTAFIGGYSGTITHFGSSFQGDAGAGFTCYAKPAFMHPDGQATEKQYRRLFMNVDEVTSATVPININFFKNYGTTVQLNRTMYLAPFQSRIDFGIPAKSLTFEFSKFSATTTIKVHGYAIAYRYQRDV